MNERVLLIATMSLLNVASLFAQTETFVNYFTVPYNMAQPVTVKTNLGTFTFSETYTIYGRIETIEAYNINGQTIVVQRPKIKEGKTADGVSCIEYYYSFISYYDDSPYVRYGQDEREHNPFYFSSRVGEVKGFMARNYPKWRRKTYIGMGYGVQYGGGYGVNITAKASRGLIGISGGVGYDNRFKDDKKPFWYLAALMGWKCWDIEMGPVCRYHPLRYRRETGIALMTNWNISIYGPFGINAGIGYFLPLEDKTEPDLEWNAGITIRLHQKEKRMAN